MRVIDGLEPRCIAREGLKARLSMILSVAWSVVSLVGMVGEVVVVWGLSR